MPVIQPMPWDSRQLGLTVGKLVDFATDNIGQLLESYDLVCARIPQRDRKAIANIQDFGFKYIGLDLCLVALPDELERTDDAKWQIRRVSRCVPDFKINGFHIEDSRLMQDPECRKRLPANFWDRLVYEHCSEFADAVIVAVNKDNQLVGFISCMMSPTHLDLFMVAVHPALQGGGVGGVLLRNAASLARERGLKLSTSVMASNVRGFNFYIRHNFLVEGGEVVMHRWRGRAHDVQ